MTFCKDFLLETTIHKIDDTSYISDVYLSDINREKIKVMRKILFIFILILSTSIETQAQDWVYDFKMAKEMAQIQHKKIILVFSGSDWCPPCKKLERNIWTSQEFIDYAKQHYILLKADFPHKRKNRLSDMQMKKNIALAKIYNPRKRFPTVLVLDENGNVLGKTGYKRVSPKEYIEILNSFIKD